MRIHTSYQPGHSAIAQQCGHLCSLKRLTCACPVCVSDMGYAAAMLVPSLINSIAKPLTTLSDKMRLIVCPFQNTNSQGVSSKRTTSAPIPTGHGESQPSEYLRLVLTNSSEFISFERACWQFTNGKFRLCIR